MLANILKEKRKELALTQQDVAEQLNVTRQTVSSWELGKNIPDVSSLIELSELYDISLDYMLKGDKQVTEKLKKDTVELKWFRFLTKTTLVIIAIIVMFAIPLSTLVIVGIYIYLTVFKKQEINIITRVKESSAMKKSSNDVVQACEDSLSIIGGVAVFYVVVSFFTKTTQIIVEERNKVMIMILFVGMAIGRYIQYKKNNS